MNDKVKEVYDNFWKDIVEHEGDLDLDAVKAELYDYKTVLNEVPIVYAHATGGQLSRPEYFATDVIAHIEEYYEKERREYILDDLESGIVRIPTFDDEVFEDVVDLIHGYTKQANPSVADTEAFVLDLFEWFRESSITK